MRFVLMLALLGPVVGLHWLLEVEDGAHVAAVPREEEGTIPPPTLAPLRSGRPRAVAVSADHVSVSGHVIGDRGRPVAGARVVSRDDDEVVCDTTITDAHGAFQLDHAFWDGPLEVDAGSRGRARTWLDDEDRREIRIGLVPGATLRGRVFAPDGGTPVANAVVVAEEDDFGTVEIRTDGEGRFVLSPVPKAQEFVLLVDGGARGRVRLPDVQCAEAGSLDVVLLPVRTLCGRVVTRDEHGRTVGVRDVEVRARERLRGKPEGAGVRTDEEGRFRCHVFGWQGHVEVISNNWYQYRGAEAFLGSKEVVAEVRPRATLRGRCELADGTPVAGAVVTCGDPVALDEVLSDATGRFETPRVGILYTQGLGIAARRGSLVGRRCVTKSPEPGYEPIVVLRPTASVRGRVLDDRGMPCAYVWAKVRYVPDPVDAPDDVEREYEITNAEGRFLVAELPIGPCKLEIEAAGFTRKMLEVSATLGGTEVGDIRLARMPVRTGQLVDPRGCAIRDGTVSVDEGACRPTPVRADGRFELGLPADLESEVDFAAPGYVERSFEIRELPSGEPWRVVLEPSPTIQGRVLDPAGRPLTNLSIYAEGVGHSEDGWACVDTDGRFCMPLTAAGTYELTLRGGHHKLPEPMLVTSGTRRLILRPDVLESIRGRVVGPDGRGLAKAGVTAWDEDVGRSELRRTLTDEEGYFRFDGLDGVTWRVTAEWLPEGMRALQLREIRVGTEDAILIAVRTQTIEGRILGVRDGTPETYGVDISARDHRDDGRTITLQPDGSFVIGNLLPGLYEVSGWRRTSRKTRERSDKIRVYAGTGNVLLVSRPSEPGSSPR